MAIQFRDALPPGAFVTDENGVVPPELNAEEVCSLLKNAAAHQAKCKADAAEFLQFYFNEVGAIDLRFLENWREKNQPLDRWFFVHLIEVAGRHFVDKSFSMHKADIARSKNKGARAFVLEQWQTNNDPGQSKAAFARQLVPLVKRAFDLVVTPDTIARDWLPKIKHSP